MDSEAYFGRLLDLTRRMLNAGMAQRWEELIELEQERQAIISKGSPATRSDRRSAVADLIREIQSCDTVLHDKLDAWMKHARILLRLDEHASAAQK